MIFLKNYRVIKYCAYHLSHWLFFKNVIESWKKNYRDKIIAHF